jgi:hypothetical protein
MKTFDEILLEKMNDNTESKVSLKTVKAMRKTIERTFIQKINDGKNIKLKYFTVFKRYVKRKPSNYMTKNWNYPPPPPK